MAVLNLWAQVRAAVQGAIKAGTSAAANKLTAAHTIQTDLGSSAAVGFDGSKDIAPGVKGVLPVAHGGTGAASLDGITVHGANVLAGKTINDKIPSLLTFLGSNARPGISFFSIGSNMLDTGDYPAGGSEFNPGYATEMVILGSMSARANSAPDGMAIFLMQPRSNTNNGKTGKIFYRFAAIQADNSAIWASNWAAFA